MITPLHTDFPNFTLPAEPRDIYFYERLAGVATQLFNARKSVSRAINIDNIFPRHIVDLASKEFPKPNFARQDGKPTLPRTSPNATVQRVSTFLVNHMQSGAFVSFIRAFTGIPGLVADPSLSDPWLNTDSSGLLQTQRGESWPIRPEYDQVDRITHMRRRVTAIVYLNGENYKSGDPSIDGRKHTRCLVITGINQTNGAHKAPSTCIEAVINRLVVVENTNESWYGHPNLSVDDYVKAIVVRYSSVGVDTQLLQSTSLEELEDRFTADVDPSAACEIIAATSNVPRMRWKPKNSIYATAPGSPGSLQNVVLDLKQSGWTCPIILYGHHFSDTLPVKTWTRESMEQNCNSPTTAEIRTRKHPGNAFKDNRADYISSTEGIMTHFVPQLASAPFAKWYAVDRKSHFSESISGKDFFCIMHRNESQNSDPSCRDIQIGLPRADVTGVRNEDIYVRFGGRFKDGPCQDLLDQVRPYHPQDGNSPGGNLNMWAGSGGVTSSAHYDLQSNLFSFIRGSRGKTILLSPPTQESLDAYAIFPQNHPSHRQAQRFFGAPNSPIRKATEQPQVTRADLAPGESLWIPVGWIHHPTTKDSSDGDTVSLSTSFVSDDTDTLMSILMDPGLLPSEDFKLPSGSIDVMRLAASLTVALTTFLKAVWDVEHPETAGESIAEPLDADMIWLKHRLSMHNGTVRHALPWMTPIYTVVRLEFSPALRDLYDLPAHDPADQERFACHLIPFFDADFEILRSKSRMSALVFANKYMRAFSPPMRLLSLRIVIQHALQLLTPTIPANQHDMDLGLRYADQCLLW